ncbi:MAG: DUF814 domain-containing protein [Nanoarchaeota archaeon]|nr:DUF814 domain-containing protein [Nanoarchaeota archaeon]
MEFKEYFLETGTKVLLGKNAENNDKLVQKFKGKSNVILHTVAPGSGFCVLLSDHPLKKEIYEAGIICAAKSQDWKNNKQDIKLHKFSGKDVKKTLFAKPGTWKIKSSPKVILIKKKDIEKWHQ